MSIPTPNSSDFQPPQNNQVNFDPYVEQKSGSSSGTDNFDHPNENQINCGAHPKPNIFQPAHKNKVNFDRPHENNVNRFTEKKAFRAWTQKTNSLFLCRR